MDRINTSVNEVLIDLVRRIFIGLARSVTWDQRIEMR